MASITDSSFQQVNQLSAARFFQELSMHNSLVKKWALAFSVITLSCVSSHAAAQNPAPQRPTLPQGFVAQYDVQYVPEGDEAQALDIYYPERAAEKPLPLLVWIHGGGWSGGSKTQVPYLKQLQRGYVVASIEYRFSQKALFPAQIQDCQAAIRWLRAHADQYSIDRDRIGVGGASAGGHLAALVGTSGGKKAFPAIGGNEDQSDRVQAVCDIFGPANFWTVITQAQEDKNVENIFKWNDGDPYSRLIGGQLGEDKEKCAAVSPVHYVSSDDPPFLILHGDRDALVPYAQSVELQGRLEKAGVQVTLQRLPGAGHGGPAFNLPAIAKLTEAFFDKHLQGIEADTAALPETEVTVPQPQ
jgi:acetyl esterase/lipase